MKLHTKKLIAPVVVTVIMLAFLAAYIALCAMFIMPVAVKIVGIGILIALAGVSIYVFVERVKEVKGGEEDDIGKY